MVKSGRARVAQMSARRSYAARAASYSSAVCTAAAYELYLSGEMIDYELSQERIDEALQRLPAVG